MSPPIRNKVHQDGLKAALVGGVLDIIATDHCPFNSTQKRMGVHDFRVIPNGVNGIEERMHMVWDTLVNPGMLGIQSQSIYPHILQRCPKLSVCVGSSFLLPWAPAAMFVDTWAVLEACRGGAGQAFNFA
jgi:hypothetical protein